MVGKFVAVEAGSTPEAHVKGTGSFTPEARVKGTGSFTATQKDPVPLTYPKYVLRDLLRMPVSRAPSARGGLQACLLFPVASGLGWRAKRGPPASESCCCHTRDGWSSCLSALSASPLYNCASRQKVGMLAAKDPQTAHLATCARCCCAPSMAHACAQMLCRRV